MKSIVEKHEKIVVVKLQGRIEIGAGDVQLRKILAESATGEVEAVVLDLAGISHVDSAGLGELVHGYKTLRARGVQLCLARVNSRVHDILTMTCLVSVFALYDSNEDALQTLWQAA